MHWALPTEQTERGMATFLSSLRVFTHLLKQMFDQFVNRILAYGYSTHLGLITFNSTARVAQPLTHVVENFRTTVQKLRDHGDTALWDAIALARDQIQEYSAAYPEAKKRILCISDGVDTKSNAHNNPTLGSGSDLWRLLAINDIVVDSFCLGNDEDEHRDLRAMSYLTNGYKFHPRSLAQAMAICEMEPVLSQLERDVEGIAASRRDLGNRPSRHGTKLLVDRFSIVRNSSFMARPEIVTQDVFPSRREHPSLSDAFVELKAVSRKDLSLNTTPGGGDANNSTSAASQRKMRTYRILSEMQLIVADPHPHMDVYVSEQNMSFWKAVMQGPPGIYEQGVFVVYLDMMEGEDSAYPAFAPKARFITPIYHPNVNRHGRICHSIFDRNWTTDTSNKMVLSTIYGLLLQPDYTDPINIVVTLDFHHDQVAFAEVARESIGKHATKTRAQWRAKILGEEGQSAG
ncbi:ubiquitin-conjugating enzyme/RWD-like protein [Diplogelasinospora grovesii]|uniref:Ubiquitin-conjugating enzyme/RWD-like protein n=1 Tax=Diplogelasinospora grovesii TaxID=303347 RepID=A0AAN6S0Z1_9PEZI|nr:ubiquitin-conjugating enzyme/RWD-like protein [Diplogelasinospora grovesii]